MRLKRSDLSLGTCKLLARKNAEDGTVAVDSGFKSGKFSDGRRQAHSAQSNYQLMPCGIGATRHSAEAGIGMKLTKWPRQPLFSRADEEKSTPALTLSIVSTGLMAMGSVSLLDEWIHGWIGAATTLGIENLFLLAALWFNRRGAIEQATRIICFSELACGLVLICKFGIGFRDEAMLLFPLMLVTAAVLLDWRSYLRFAGLVVVSVSAAGFIVTGMRHNTRVHTVVDVVNILLITAVATGLLARDLKRSLGRSRAAERDVKALSIRLIEAQEQERRRLALELHDDLSQQVAALSLGLSNLTRKMGPESVAQSARLHEKLVQLAESMRHLSHELHPAALEHSGLKAALRNYCREFAELTSHRIKFHAAGDCDDLPPLAALCVYRIAQEALQNSIRHAQSEEAEIALTREHDAVCLVVSDHGAGMRPDALPGLGLVSIKERARLLNGIVEVESKPGEGFTVKLRVPMPPGERPRSARSAQPESAAVQDERG